MTTTGGDDWPDDEAATSDSQSLRPSDRDERAGRSCPIEPMPSPRAGDKGRATVAGYLVIDVTRADNLLLSTRPTW